MRAQRTPQPLDATTPLAWLLWFAYEADVEQAGKFGRLVRDTLRFFHGAGSRPSAWSEDRGRGSQDRTRAAEPSARDPDPRPALRTLQARAQAHLAVFRDHGRIPTNMRVVELEWQYDGQVAWRVGGGEAQRFDAAVALTLVQGRDRLRRCPGARCARVFVKVGKQGYCSRACNQRSRFARYKERHSVALILRRKRQRAAEETARLLGDAMPAPTTPPRQPRTRRFARRPR
jgi:hypothetical protein